MNSSVLQAIENFWKQQDRIAELTSGIFDSPALKAMESITKMNLMFENSSFKALQEQQDSIAKIISMQNSLFLNNIQVQQNSMSAMVSAFESPILKAIENIPTISSMIDTTSLNALQEQQDRVAQLTSGIFDSPGLKAMETITQASLLLESASFKALQEQQSSIAEMVSGIFDNPLLKEQENNFFKTTSLFDAENIQRILDEIDITEIKETDITKEEKSLIDETFQAISVMNPEIGAFIESLKLKKYSKATIFMMIWFIFNILSMYQLYNDIFNSDTHYKVNRDNVRVRLSPNKEDNKNIITKLNKNTYIEKLDSENGWTKVRFELDSGIEKEGWIYRTMITKMD